MIQFNTVSYYLLLDFRFFSLPVTGSFQRSLAVLFAIGLNKYLGLEVDSPHIPASYPRDGTLELPLFLPSYTYATITLYREAFQPTSVSQMKTLWGSELHISAPFQVWIRFALSGFRSLLLTGSQLISSPSVTKMFQFTEFSLIPEQLMFRGLIRVSTVLRLRAPRRGISQLVAPFINC